MIAELERASLRAWPALEEVVLDGWPLRFSGGTTKRLNSVQPVGASTIPLQEKVDRCEAWYAAKGRTCIFRLTPLSEPALEGVLSARGYELTAPCLVLHRALEGAADARGPAGFREVELDGWLEIAGSVAGEPQTPHRFKREVLSRIAGDRLLAVLAAEDGSPVACGVGVIEGEAFGLFDLLVSPERRRQGFGRSLVRSMLAWARRRGARHAYLQVTEENRAARRLYEGLAFSTAYPYWYRVQRADPQRESPP